MSFIRRIFSSKEVKAALTLVDKCEPIFRSDGFFGDSFKIIEAELVPYIYKNQKDIQEAIQGGRTVSDCIYTAVATVAQNQLVGGQHHVYRGVLNPIGPAPALHRIFKKAVDLLVKEGAISTGLGNKWKAEVQKLIAQAG